MCVSRLSIPPETLRFIDQCVEDENIMQCGQAMFHVKSTWKHNDYLVEFREGYAWKCNKVYRSCWDNLCDWGTQRGQTSWALMNFINEKVEDREWVREHQRQSSPQHQSVCTFRTNPA